MSIYLDQKKIFLSQPGYTVGIGNRGCGRFDISTEEFGVGQEAS